MFDKYNRKIDYLRLSVTDLCNLRCFYCMPAEGVPQRSHGEILSLEEMEKIAAKAVDLGITKIRLTGGEPLVKRGLVPFVERLARLKKKGLKDLGLTTNGVLLKELAHPLKKAGLDRVNISLDTLDAKKYREITHHDKFADVMEGIKAARQAGLSPLKLNVVLIEGFNDDEIENFIELTVQNDIELRFIELMPIGEAANWDRERFLTSETILKKVPRLIPMPFKGHGSVARLYKLPSSRGSVGIISPMSKHFCQYCNKIRITPDGKLKPCLHSDIEIDFRDYGEEHIEQYLLDGIRGKPLRHHMNHGNFVPIWRNMHEIGG